MQRRHGGECLLALLALAASSKGQNVWVQVPNSDATLRLRFARCVYDTARQRTLYFVSGGSATLPNETWEWDGFQWLGGPTGGPSERDGFSMAFDEARGTAVLFGGFQFPTYHADTWLWNGTAWYPALPAVGPSGRRGAAMAYDNARQVTVLNGGYDGTVYWNDTWEWNGLSWTNRGYGGPPARQGATMVFDRQRNCCVLVGGVDPSGTWRTDTWEWDGTSWVQRAATGITFTNGLVGAYHAGLSRTVAWNGLETWQWDGATWSLLPATGVQPDVTGMAYDALHGRITGVSPKPGFPPTAVEVHELATGSAAGAYPFGAGCGSPGLALTQVPGALPALGGTAQVTVTTLPASFAAVTIGFSDTAFGPYQLPASLTFLGMPGCTLLQSSEFAFLATPGAPGTATFALSIPNQAALFGQRLFLQGWAHAPGFNAAGFVVSNGICWVCG